MTENRPTNIIDEEPEPYVVPLSTDGSEMLAFDTKPPHPSGGWAALWTAAASRDLAMAVIVRIGPESAGDQAAYGIREVRFVLESQGTGFSPSLMRALPATRIEAAVNQAEHREVLKDLVYPWIMVESGEPLGKRFRMIRPQPVKARRPRLRITDPGGYKKPDAFYQAVAEKFLALAAVSNRPAHELAEANSVPPATVHRWIREAKDRGLLILPSHRSDG